MSARIETRVAIGGLLLLAAIVALIQSQAAEPTSTDPRRSTFLHGPAGAAGLADGLGHLGVAVERQRRRYASLLDRGDSITPATAFAVLDPSEWLDKAEGIQLAEWPVRKGDLVLAGVGADAAMACFGYRARARQTDSVQARSPAGGDSATTPWVSAMLARHQATEIVDSGSGALDLTRCLVPPIVRAETLLVSRSGRAIAVRLHPEGYAGTVTLVADGRLFSNRLIRETDAGVFALGLFAGRDSIVIFDERHHGFGPTGSLFDATLEWSTQSPFGWLTWQLTAVGVLLLLFSAIRFGPARPLDDRKRRSALEHVTALATALSAAQGHDTAIHLMIRGLARRLAADGRRLQDPDQLLVRLKPVLRTDRGRQALAQLQALTRPGQPAESVLTAANAVEDVWQDLRP
ncbi:MAG: DUF4350 domain-containing protein [Gemmatimonadota bacterium]